MPAVIKTKTATKTATENENETAAETAAETATKVDGELASRLRLALMRLARRLRQQHDTDATASQLSALSSVALHGPITLGELAALERVAPPSMTRIVSHLEDRELVLRETDPADRRVARVSLTTEGNRLLRQSREAKTAYLAARIDRLSPAERATLQAALPVIEKLLGDPE